jgi:hypothetical protein
LLNSFSYFFIEREESASGILIYIFYCNALRAFL